MKKRAAKQTPMKIPLNNVNDADFRYGSLSTNNAGNGSDVEDAESISLNSGEAHELTVEIDVFDKLSIVVNCLNALFGVALFVTPWGFQESGILGGLVIVSTVSILSYETARILLLSQKSYYLEQGQIKSYPEMASAALGTNYHYIVQVATVISCLGGCTGYLIFLGQTLGQVFSMPAENVIVIGTLPLVLLSWVRTFADLSYTTMLGMVAVIASIAVLFIDGMGHIKNVSSAPLFIPSNAPNFLGPSTFLFTIHYCILSMGAEFLQSKRLLILQNDPEDNQGATISININLLFSSLSESIAISYVLTTVVTVLVGCLGFLMYRNVALVIDADGFVMPGCEQPVCQNVVLNISPGIMSNFVAISMSVMILFSYLVLLVPAREHIEGAIISLLPNNTNSIIVSMIRNTIRTAIVLSNVIIAIRAPYFGGMLGSVGGLTDAFLCFIVPPLIYVSIFKDDLSYAKKVFYNVLAAFGVCIIVYTLFKLINSY